MTEAKKSYSSERLEELFARAKRGQSEARNEIFLFLHTRFLELAKLRLIEDDAKEVVQDMMIVVERHMGEIESTEGLLAFTNKVLKNKIGNFYRKRDYRKQFHADWEEIPELVYDFEQDVEGEETERAVKEALNQVAQRSERCRQVLLALVEGDTMEELMVRFGMSRTQIDDWLYRCRKYLREVLEKEYGLRF